MKIIYLASQIKVPSSDDGGLGGSTHTIEVARHLKMLGVDVQMVCASSASFPEWDQIEGTRLRRFFHDAPSFGREAGPSYQRQTLPLNVAVRKLRALLGKPFRLFQSAVDALRLYGWVKRSGFDLIYERASRSSIAGTLISQWLNVPMVAEVNDLEVAQYTLRRARALIVPDPHSLEEMYRTKAVQLPWGVDTEEICPMAKPNELVRRLQLDRHPVVIFIGSFLGWHGVDAIVNSLPGLVSLIPEVRFLLVGTGPELGSAKEMAQRTGLLEHFIFTGFVPHSQISMYLNTADVAVAPYTKDLDRQQGRAGMACSLKLLEYMAAGKPVVVTEVGNRAQIVKDGETGLVIEDAIPELLVSAIYKLLSNPDLATRLGENARKVVETKYSWQEHCKNLVKVFEEAIGR